MRVPIIQIYILEVPQLPPIMPPPDPSATGATATLSDESITQFYIEAHKISTEAQFIISSLPNAERHAVERVIRQLQVIHGILMRLEDPLTAPSELQDMQQLVLHLLQPLEAFLSSPPPPPSQSVPRHQTGQPGRPSYAINLQRAQELHALGNSWADVSSALGVDRKTLYNHLRAAGLSSARPAHADISDEDLDELVAEISLSHPFVGSTIVHGHLQSRGISVPMRRVNESMRRVDPLGVLVRYVRSSKIHFGVLLMCCSCLGGQA